MSQQRDYKNSFESRQRAALSALVLLVALVLSCLGAAVAVSKALKGTEMNLAQAQIGSMIYVAAAYILFAVYMAVYQRDTFDGANLMTMVCIQLVLMPWMQVLGNMLEPHVTPMVMAVLLIAELVNHKTALAAGVLLGFESAVLAGGTEGILTTTATVMMAANIASCAASVFALKRINTRGGMIAASGIGGAAGAAVTAAIYIALGATVREILTYAGCVLFSALFSGLFVTGSLTIWEELFDIATPARLNELLNTGNPLLKQLMYDAPGTYQHCMNVAALAEGAAEKIGANALLAKVGAAYHDVGKLRRPQYFKENQQAENIHDTLSPQESASIIIAHQKDGATILAKNKLPGAVVRIAAEHHGNSMMTYFYRKAAETDPNVNPKGFRYPGNKPSTREGAIVMLADCCEAAVRSLGDCTREAREAMVHKIIWGKLTDGENQLSEVPLTLADISSIEKSFIRTFGGLMHDRIEYPEEAKKE